MTAAPLPPTDVTDWLTTGKRILVVTHERPDGDALGSIAATVHALRGAGFGCCGFVARDWPEKYRRIFTTICEDRNAWVGHHANQGAFDGLLCLDASTWKRVELPGCWDPAAVTVPVCNVDHHPDNQRYGHVNWVDGASPATAEMVLRLLAAADVGLDASSANALLSGLLMDTGGFRFRNTGPRAFAAGAELVEAGADYGMVVDRLFFQEPYGKSCLKAELVKNAAFEFGGALLYTVLTPDRLDAYALTPADTEDMIDAVRGIAGVQVACLIQQVENDVRLSFRARDERYDVSAVARKLGGGGHVVAAGARLENATVDQAVDELLKAVAPIIEANANTQNQWTLRNDESNTPTSRSHA